METKSNERNALRKRARARGFGSEERKSEVSNEDAEYIGDGILEGSTRRAEITEVIGGFFGSAGEERKD